jgi:hypothetical protein
MTDTVLAATELRRVNARLVEPHRRLMVAVLQTVLDDCRGSAHRRRAGRGPATNLPAARHAIAYVASTDRAWPFSFENICEALGLDASSLRRELQKEPGA